MIVFHLQFGNEMPGTRELFFRGDAADGGHGSLRFRAGQRASFDTYFNLLSHAMYKRYCGMTRFVLSLHGMGKFRADFFHQPDKGESTPFYSCEFDDCADIGLDLSDVPANGFVYFALTALSDGELFSGHFAGEPVQTNDVRIAAVVCTYRRESFVEKNLRRVDAAVQAWPEWADRLHFFVVDNARTLRLPPSPLYTIFPNRNLGGSGGFARGMAEAFWAGGYTHVLLMDDDICFDFSTLQRTHALLSALLPAHAQATVGGAMLLLDRPTVQYEAGGRFDGARLFSCNRNLPLEQTASLLQNERPAPANYTAWWYCCMPLSYIAAHGLPLPLFIKFDDVEYGLRCAQEILLCNGIGIWHQGFAEKYNCALEYYTKRNSLLVGALHFRLRQCKSAFVFLYGVYKQLALKRYAAAELVLRAYEDFFRGPDFFEQTDAEKLNAEIQAARPRELSQKELAALYGAAFTKAAPQKSRSSLFLRVLALLENILPRRCFRNELQVFLDPVQPDQTFRCGKCLYYSAASAQGYVCELDVRRRRKIKRRARKIFFRLLFRYRKTAQAYRLRAETLASFPAWNKHFGF